MASYYISPTGNDTTGNGTSGNPWKTADKAYTNSSSGDTIYFKDGTYAWGDAVLGQVANIATGGRVLRAVNNYAAIVDGASATALKSIIADNNSSASIWSMIGLIWQNASFDTNDSPFRANSAAGTLTVSNCKFNLLGLANYGFGRATVGLTYTNCQILDCWGISGSRALFQYAFTASYPITLNNCSITIKTTAPFPIVYIANPVGNTGMSITVKNTIIKNSTGGTINWDDSGGTLTTTASYSDFYLITGSPSGTGVITSDPLFVDETGGNLNLRPTSPCIDAGTLL